MKKLGSRSKWKIQRALGLELPGLGRPGALEKRNYPPGQHGPKAKKKKLGGYALQLREKQKLLFHYALREEQLQRFVRVARGKQASDWMETLIGMLERRIDNIVFRLGFARSIAGARQLVSHGHILVDGKRHTIGSMVLRVGSRVALSEKARGFSHTQDSLKSPRLSVPSYLQPAGGDTASSSDAQEWLLSSVPDSQHIPFEFNKTMVAEYYSK